MIAPNPKWFDMTDEETRPLIMRHDCCGGDRCWNDIHRPRLELLKKCFGGLETKIKPMDVDGCVEHNGFFLHLEFKGSRENFEHPRNPKKKTALDIQETARTQQYRVLCRKPLVLSTQTTTTLYIVGDSKTMTVEEYKEIYDGKIGDWIRGDLHDLRVRCWQWFQDTMRWHEEDNARLRAEKAAIISENPFIKST